MATTSVTITWYRNAGDSNYLYGMPGGTIGPNSGSRTVNVTNGTSYSLSASGSGPGYVGISANGNRLGLDDRQGAGADGDFDDMLVYVSAGFFSGPVYYAPSAIYGCTDPSALNYNSNANSDDGTCRYPAPVPTISASPTSYINNGQGSSRLTWSVSNSSYATSITLNGSPVSASGNLLVSPTQTTDYVLRTTFTVRTEYYPSTTLTSTARVTVYQPPVVTLTLDDADNAIPLGDTTTLRWSTTGDADRITISPGIGNSLLTSASPVSPTVTTTYTAVATGLGGSGNAEITLVVWQPPTLTIGSPININYGDNTSSVTYEVTNTNSISGMLRYVDLDGNDISVVNLTLPLNQTRYNLNDIPWGNRAPVKILGSFTAYGDGGLYRTRSFEISINIDQTPDYIEVPESGDKISDEEPVISPDVEVVSTQIVISDIDIPVEIKANYPIQVELDNSALWQDIRQL